MSELANLTIAQIHAGLERLRAELASREAAPASSEPRPLEVYTTDDLVAELFERFEDGLFVGEQWRTDELRREYGQWKGDRLRLLGLVDILHQRIVTEEMANRFDNTGE